MHIIHVQAQLLYNHNLYPTQYIKAFYLEVLKKMWYHPDHNDPNNKIIMLWKKVKWKKQKKQMVELLFFCHTLHPVKYPKMILMKEEVKDI